MPLDVLPLVSAGVRSSSWEFISGQANFNDNWGLDDLRPDFKDGALDDRSFAEFAELGIDQFAEGFVGGFRTCVSHGFVWLGLCCWLRFPSDDCPGVGNRQTPGRHRLSGKKEKRTPRLGSGKPVARPKSF